jgi:restriction endonuclease S subunit
VKAGWQIKPLGELCDVIGGGTPPKDRPDYYGGDIPWATVRDMRADIITSTEHSITSEAVKASATNIIPAGNVVIATRVGQKQQAFLAFVLDQYVTQGVDQLDADKLTPLLKLRYNALNDAMAELGDAVQVRQAFVGMQRYLYKDI